MSLRSTRAGRGDDDNVYLLCMQIILARRSRNKDNMTCLGTWNCESKYYTIMQM